MYFVGLLVLLVGLLISVALHELGHLVPAKKFGALVPEYWVGFGPTIFSKQIKGTRYGMKWLLLGGYVRILGMFAPGKKTYNRRGQLTLAAEARDQSSEEIAAAREDGATGKPFYQLGTGQKLTIMFGGPLMNLVLAFVFTMIAVMALGWQVPTTTVSQVSATQSELGLDSSSAAPAASAGIEPGDKIVAWSVQDQTITPGSWEELTAAIANTGTKEAEVTLERDGNQIITHLVPVLDAQGEPKVGITPTMARQRGSLGDAASQTWDMTTGTVAALGSLPASLWNLATSMFTDAPRDPNGALSVVGVARIAGDVTALDSGTGVTFADRAAMLLSLLASLNIALFIFNLIPLPPLDGGHIAGALWGGAKNTWARLRHRPRPKPVDTARMVPLTYAVFGVLMVMTVILVVADFVKPLQLF